MERIDIDNASIVPVSLQEQHLQKLVQIDVNPRFKVFTPVYEACVVALPQNLAASGFLTKISAGIDTANKGDRSLSAKYWNAQDAEIEKDITPGMITVPDKYMDITTLEHHAIQVGLGKTIEGNLITTNEIPGAVIHEAGHAAYLFLQNNHPEALQRLLSARRALKDLQRQYLEEELLNKGLSLEEAGEMLLTAQLPFLYHGPNARLTGDVQRLFEESQGPGDEFVAEMFCAYILEREKMIYFSEVLPKYEADIYTGLHGIITTLDALFADPSRMHKVEKIYQALGAAKAAQLPLLYDKMKQGDMQEWSRYRQKYNAEFEGETREFQKRLLTDNLNFWVGFIDAGGIDTKKLPQGLRFNQNTITKNGAVKRFSRLETELVALSLEEDIIDGTPQAKEARLVVKETGGKHTEWFSYDFSRDEFGYFDKLSLRSFSAALSYKYYSLWDKALQAFRYLLENREFEVPPPFKERGFIIPPDELYWQILGRRPEQGPPKIDEFPLTFELPKEIQRYCSRVDQLTRASGKEAYGSVCVVKNGLLANPVGLGGRGSVVKFGHLIWKAFVMVHGHPEDPKEEEDYNSFSEFDVSYSTSFPNSACMHLVTHKDRVRALAQGAKGLRGPLLPYANLFTVLEFIAEELKHWRQLTEPGEEADRIYYESIIAKIAEKKGYQYYIGEGQLSGKEPIVMKLTN